MALAGLLTLLAIAGAWAGVFWGHGSASFSHQLAAAGGGLLFGISLFWLVPEIGETAGAPLALLITIAVALALTLLDKLLAHSGQSGHHRVVWPLLLATAIHSLLDGWSVRLLSLQPLTNIAVTAGLALHKIPEGAAVGWLTQRSLNRPKSAFILSASIELFTLVGALAEPRLNALGTARFGASWTPAVLSLIAGGFLFLAAHALVPAWKRRHVPAIFLLTCLLVGALTFFRSPV
jgi:zinc transporter ZupT